MKGRRRRRLRERLEERTCPAVWVILMVTFVLSFSGANAQSTSLEADCEFLVHEYQRYRGDGDLPFPGKDLAWHHRLYDAIKRTTKGTPVAGRTVVNARNLIDEDGKHFFPQCAPDSAEKLQGYWVGRVVATLETLTVDLKSRLRRLEYGLLAALIIMLAQIGLGIIACRRLRRSSSPGANAGSRSKDLEQGWRRTSPIPLHVLDRQGQSMAEIEAALSRLESRLPPTGAIETATTEIVTELKDLVAALKPGTAQSTAPSLEGRPRVSDSGMGVGPGTGPVSRLRAVLAPGSPQYKWGGTSNLFQPSADGEFAIAANTGYLIPMIDRIRARNDWYRIPDGFTYDPSERGVIVVEQQAVLERQDDGSYLLKKKGHLRAVDDG